MLTTYCFCFFFFKQKTAYEMRISDWSSDVCSSDLVAGDAPRLANEIRLIRQTCARKPIAPAIFPQANSNDRKKVSSACPATTQGSYGAPGAIRTPEPQIRSFVVRLSAGFRSCPATFQYTRLDR